MNIERLFSEEPEFETDRLLLRKWDKHETIDDTIKYLENVISKYGAAG